MSETVRVQLPVVIGVSGEWACQAESNLGVLTHVDRLQGRLPYMPGNALHIVEVDIPVPSVSTIEGKVING